MLERAQLVRYGALRGADELGEVGDAQLTRHERIQNLDARRVAEHLEQVGEVVEQLLVRQTLGRLVEGEVPGVAACAAVVVRARRGHLLAFLILHGRSFLLTYEQLFISIRTNGALSRVKERFSATLILRRLEVGRRGFVDVARSIPPPPLRRASLLSTIRTRKPDEAGRGGDETESGRLATRDASSMLAREIALRDGSRGRRCGMRAPTHLGARAGKRVCSGDGGRKGGRWHPAASGNAREVARSFFEPMFHVKHRFASDNRCQEGERAAGSRSSQFRRGDPSSARCGRRRCPPPCAKHAIARGPRARTLSATLHAQEARRPSRSGQALKPQSAASALKSVGLRETSRATRARRCGARREIFPFVGNTTEERGGRMVPS